MHFAHTLILVLSVVYLIVGALSQDQPISSSPNPSDECSNPPYDSCSFYPDCLESRFHCGPSGYPIGYGLKYCTKFSRNRSELSSAGRAWMVNTMHCLQTTLVPEALGQVNMTCQELEATAFDTHAGCYIEEGLCRLSPEDWIAIVNIVGARTLVDSWDALKESLEAAGHCAEFIAFAVENVLVRRLKKDIEEL